ncbi:hypothetical protein WR25_03465 [Diploscapter pachys]|uniref:Cytochrome P450 n=1 Tax=Diploscapter pachys TaxID=2018661 RepID=A0A2A2LAX3_9BILA|nr:hypothetical protein WR25_03465 [Diploscapter pachys]
MSPGAPSIVLACHFIRAHIASTICPVNDDSEKCDLPGPRALPLVGCVYQFKLNAEEFTYQMEIWTRRYVYTPKISGMGLIWLGPFPIVLLGLSDTVRPLLESSANIKKPTLYDKVQEWIGNGLLTSTGEKWFNRRKMLTSTFHFNVLQGYQETFSKQAEIFVEILEKKVGEPFDVFPYIKRCALDIICETAMGTQVNAQFGQNEQYVAAVARITQIIWEFQRFPHLWIKPIWYLSGKGFEFNRLVQATNDFTRKVIADRKATLQELHEDEVHENPTTNKKKAFLDLLLSMQQENQLSDEDIREEVDTFMFEGHDTTSSAMGFAIWFLGQYPDYQAKVHEELDRVFGSSNRSPTPEDLKQLVYLEKCIKESLRMMPAVPMIARVLDEDMEIESNGAKVLLPQGLTVVISPFSAQRDFRSYERVESFYPEHFDSENIAKRNAFSFIPFSAGPRNCIGQKFAIQEEKTILSWLFRRFTVETVHPFPINRPNPEITLKPKRELGFTIIIKRR